MIQLAGKRRGVRFVCLFVCLMPLGDGVVVQQQQQQARAAVVATIITPPPLRERKKDPLNHLFVSSVVYLFGRTSKYRRLELYTGKRAYL